MTAALFVEPDTVYRSLGLDCWDATRDARKYRGPDPAICHPPCERYGRYWSGGPSAKTPRHMADDNGCFAHAVWVVRTFGGVIEHPEGSHGWTWFGVEKPKAGRGWTEPDRWGGSSVTVDQGAYGHPARKRTWLYAVGTSRPEPLLCDGGRQRLEPGFHSREEATAARARDDWRPPKRLNRQQRIGTPLGFARFLLDLVGGRS